MAAYYNEIDKYAAQWLRNLIEAGLIAPGDVDERSIVDVSADDLKGYTQCHFFAGIGGWSCALRLAGWPDDRPVWTGSCPCQPFSAASSVHKKSKKLEDERHLWPYMRDFIHYYRPEMVYMEQVERLLERAGSTGCLATWKILTTHGKNQRYSRLCVQAPRIKGIGYGLLYTPVASESVDRAPAKSLAALDKNGRIARRICKLSPMLHSNPLSVTLNPSFALTMMGYPPEWLKHAPKQ